MLSAVAAVTGFATPTFVVEGHASRSITPAVSAGTAPIDPAQMDAAYGVSSISFNGTVGNGAGQTIAIVDAYNDPDIVSDANSFSSQWGLPAFNGSGEPTLSVLNETGGTSLPANASPEGWDLEESLDVEWAHSIAPEANIILYEANSNSDSDLFTAIKTAETHAGVSVVSMSWSGGESSSETSLDSYFTTSGVTFLAATGDSGSPSGYPAYSPDVVAVGGTTLDINSSGQYIAEGAWSDGGGGISLYETIPSYQDNLDGVNGASTTHRNVPDVSMDADPNSGVYVLDSYAGGWFQVGGTSLSTPMWGGLIAIANQGRALAGEAPLSSTQTLSTLYSLPSSDFHDITTGGNGTYNAGPGYDLVTGIGTPVANLLVPGLAGTSTSPTAPTISAPSSESLGENTSYVFSGNITVADSSIGTNSDTVTLAVSDGTLTLGSTSGLSSYSGNGSDSVSLTGTVAELNTALSGLTYTPTSGFTGSDSLVVKITDPGNSLSATSTVTLTVNAPTAPTITAPASASLTENSSVTFSGSSAISVADASAGSNADTVTLTVSDGTLTLGSTSGLSSYSGNGSDSVTLSGTVAELNSALSGTVYKPNSGFTGSDSLKISISDPGDSLSASATVSLTVTAASAPTITAPTSVSLSENQSVEFEGSISITDSAAGSGTEQLALSATHGTLRLGTTSGITITSGANRSASMTITGTLTRLNAALDGLIYTPTTNYTGSASIGLTYTDTGDKLTASATVAITLTGRGRGGVRDFVGDPAPFHQFQTAPVAFRVDPLNTSEVGSGADNVENGTQLIASTALHNAPSSFGFVAEGGANSNFGVVTDSGSRSGDDQTSDSSAGDLAALWEGLRAALAMLG